MVTKFILVLICSFPVLSTAETFVLKSGEQITGKIMQVVDGVYHVRLTSKEVRTIKAKDLYRIEYATSKETTKSKKKALKKQPENFLTSAKPKNNSPYATPKLTFQKWKQAAEKGDIDGMAKAYASFRQKEVRKQLKKIPKSKRKEMQETTSRTDFIPGDPYYQGDRAVLEVTWRSGAHTDTQSLKFILEGNDWKILQ